MNTIMQRVTLVRYTVKPDQAAANKALAQEVFKELRASAPDDMAYGLFQNGADFVHLFVNVRDDSAEALTELPAFKGFVKDITARCAAPVDVTRLTADLLESYGFPAAG
jgi:hypothetical protein